MRERDRAKQVSKLLSTHPLVLVREKEWRRRRETSYSNKNRNVSHSPSMLRLVFILRKLIPLKTQTRILRILSNCVVCEKIFGMHLTFHRTNQIF